MSHFQDTEPKTMTEEKEKIDPSMDVEVGTQGKHSNTNTVTPETVQCRNMNTRFLIVESKTSYNIISY